MLHRKGNKAKLADQIIRLFPPHDCYIEPFFGSGSIFFKKPLAKYNLINDIDENVYNLNKQMRVNSHLFKTALQNQIICEKTIKESLINSSPCDIQRAVDFLISANFSLMSTGSTIRLARTNQKEICLNKIEEVVIRLSKAIFSNKDALKMLDAVDKRALNIKTNFCYVDPPYLNTKAYKSNFKKEDVVKLLDKLKEKKLRFAYSEFDNPFILKQAKQRGFHVHFLGERKNIGSRKTEILLTNY